MGQMTGTPYSFLKTYNTSSNFLTYSGTGTNNNVSLATFNTAGKYVDRNIQASINVNYIKSSGSANTVYIASNSSGKFETFGNVTTLTNAHTIASLTNNSSKTITTLTNNGTITTLTNSGTITTLTNDSSKTITTFNNSGTTTIIAQSGATTKIKGYGSGDSYAFTHDSGYLYLNSTAGTNTFNLSGGVNNINVSAGTNNVTTSSSSSPLIANIGNSSTANIVYIKSKDEYNYFTAANTAYIKSADNSTENSFITKGDVVIHSLDANSKRIIADGNTYIYSLNTNGIFQSCNSNTYIKSYSSSSSYPFTTKGTTYLNNSDQTLNITQTGGTLNLECKTAGTNKVKATSASPLIPDGIVYIEGAADSSSSSTMYSTKYLKGKSNIIYLCSGSTDGTGIFRPGNNGVTKIGGQGPNTSNSSAYFQPYEVNVPIRCPTADSGDSYSFLATAEVRIKSNSSSCPLTIINSTYIQTSGSNSTYVASGKNFYLRSASGSTYTSSSHGGRLIINAPLYACSANSDSANYLKCCGSLMDDGSVKYLWVVSGSNKDVIGIKSGTYIRMEGYAAYNKSSATANNIFYGSNGVQIYAGGAWRTIINASGDWQCVRSGATYSGGYEIARRSGDSTTLGVHYGAYTANDGYTYYGKFTLVSTGGGTDPGPGDTGSGPGVKITYGGYTYITKIYTDSSGVYLDYSGEPSSSQTIQWAQGNMGGLWGWTSGYYGYNGTYYSTYVVSLNSGVSASQASIWFNTATLSWEPAS